MQVSDRTTFGAKSKAAQDWRAKLFSDDPASIGEAQAEGLNELSKRLGSRGRHKWWAFEGFTHIDCCLVTDECVLFVEGKRTEGVSPSTRWFEQRSQLWRNVEAAKEFAGAKEFAMILAVENAADGTTALTDGSASLVVAIPISHPSNAASWPAISIGFVTWAEVVTRFGLSRTSASAGAVVSSGLGFLRSAPPRTDFVMIRGSFPCRLALPPPHGLATAPSRLPHQQLLPHAHTME